MEEFLSKINNDSIFMIIAAVSTVILIFVLLMVVISSMRIKTYKNRFINSQIDNQEKNEFIEKQQKELENIKILNAKNEQELKEFRQTQKLLTEAMRKLKELQTSSKALHNLQNETKIELDYKIILLETLTQKHQLLTEKFNAIKDENSKLRVNNTRLLVKLQHR